MPELPEVETVAADLRPLLAGPRFVAAPHPLAAHPGRAGPRPAERGLAGRQVLDVGRRGKYLLIHLDSGETLIFHLRMTGQLAVVRRRRARAERPASARLVRPGGRRRLAFTDPRKFGRIWLVDDVARVVGKLGPEPLDWLLHPRAAGRTPARPPRGDQGAAARSDRGRRGRQHLRGRGALPGGHPSPAPARQPDREEIGRLRARSARCWPNPSISAARCCATIAPPTARPARTRTSLRVYQQTGRPCPRCGAADRAHPRDAAQHSLLPALPTRAGMTRGRGHVPGISENVWHTRFCPIPRAAL